MPGYFLKALTLIWRPIREADSKLAQCRILLMSSWLCEDFRWMAIRLRPHTFWRSFSALSFRVGLRLTRMGQLLEARVLLVMLTSFVHAEASSKATLLFSLSFGLLSRLSWLLMSTRFEYIWSFSWRWLWLESDSAYLMALLRSRSCRVPWRWRLIWERCLSYFTQMDFNVTHIYWKDNRIADCLGSKAPSIVAPTWWWTPPAFCCSFVFYDVCTRPSFTFCWFSFGLNTYVLLFIWD